MNKTELVAAIAARTGGSKTQAAEFLDAALDAVTEALQNGERVQIIGFGAIEVKTRKGRNGVNPKTGEPVQIAERRVPVFTASKVFREQVG